MNESENFEISAQTVSRCDAPCSSLQRDSGKRDKQLHLDSQQLLDTKDDLVKKSGKMSCMGLNRNSESTKRKSEYHWSNDWERKWAFFVSEMQEGPGFRQMWLPPTSQSPVGYFLPHWRETTQLRKHDPLINFCFSPSLDVYRKMG